MESGSFDFKVKMENKIRVITYCSFATEEGFLGAIVFEGDLNPIQAYQMAWDRGINPGGQLMAGSCKETDEDIPKEIFESMYQNKNRLLTIEEVKSLFNAKSIKEFAQEENILN